MDWQTLMASLDLWLWKAPYLDIPNYAWAACALGIAVCALYLIVIMLEPAVEEEAPSDDIEPPEPKVVKEAPIERPAPPEPEAVEGPLPEKVPEEAPEEEPEEVELVPPEGWMSRLRSGLEKTQGKFSGGLTRLLSDDFSDELMDELEELLITSDLGVQTSLELLERLREAVRKDNLKGGDQLRECLKNEVSQMLSRVESPLTIPDDHEGPYVIMVTGVNGTGKTTTVGKLALRFRQEGRSVLLGAADTFRAAAIEQLEIWGKRAHAPVIKHKEGADPSAVAFDTIKAAQARGVDVVIIDTAGRLHTKANLMEELKKAKRIIGRELPTAPHEIILVLDATTGQNAVAQTKTFNEVLGITGIVLTKLDGTAKGGIIVAISNQFNIPIRFIGVGEKIYDLQPFNASEFLEAIF